MVEREILHFRDLFECFGLRMRLGNCVTRTRAPQSFSPPEFEMRNERAVPMLKNPTCGAQFVKWNVCAC